jgi:hypothetical protein
MLMLASVNSNRKEGAKSALIHARRAINRKQRGFSPVCAGASAGRSVNSVFGKIAIKKLESRRNRYILHVDARLGRRLGREVSSCVQGSSPCPVFS